VAQALVAIQSGAGPSQVIEALGSGAGSYNSLSSIATQNNLPTTNNQDTAPESD